MLLKNAIQKVHVYAYDSTTGAAKTGDAGNITGYVSLDGTANAIDDTNPAEVDSTNMPGVYVFDLTAPETNCDAWALYAKSSTANIRIEPIIGFTTAGTAAALVASVSDKTGFSLSATGADLTALATAAELAKVPKSDAAVTWNATALGSINAEVDTALNTAIPGSPTADSINERIVAIDAFGAPPSAATIAAATRDVNNATPAASSLGAAVNTAVSDIAAVHVHVADLHDTDLPAVKAETAAILEDTGTTLDTKLNTIDDFLDTEVAAILAAVDTEVATIVAQTASMGIRKNTALANFEFAMINSTDHVTPQTGLTVAANKSIDGAAFVACVNSVVEVSNGVYKINLAAADVNGDVITLRFSATGADDLLITFKTQA